MSKRPLKDDEKREESASKRQKQDGDAMCDTGWDLFYKNKFKEAVTKYFQPLAKKGHARAQNAMGYCFQRGMYVKQNYEEAFKWYNRAHNKGYLEAQVNLGYLYDNGVGVVQNRYYAFQLFLDAAKKGNRSGQNNVGFAYEHGYGVEKNMEEALRWFDVAAKRGCSAAQLNLGLYHWENKSFEKAFYWWFRASQNGSFKASFYIGELFEEGDHLDKCEKSAM